MRYTYKKISGLLAMMLGVMLLSRYAPDWMFFGLVGIVAVAMLYLIYCYSGY